METQTLRTFIILGWLAFVVCTYFFIIFAFSWMRILSSDAGPMKVSKLILRIFLTWFAVQAAFMIAFVIFYFTLDGSTILLDSKFSSQTKHLVFLPFVIVWSILIGLLFITMLLIINMMVVKFSPNSLHIYGVEIGYRSIIEMKNDKTAKSLTIKYVYLQKDDKNWTEEIVFWNFSEVTNFILTEGAIFFDPELNRKAFEDESRIASQTKK